jgi:hypothetical protein
METGKQEDKEKLTQRRRGHRVDGEKRTQAKEQMIEIGKWKLGNRKKKGKKRRDPEDAEIAQRRKGRLPQREQRQPEEAETAPANREEWGTHKPKNGRTQREAGDASGAARCRRYRLV